MANEKSNKGADETITLRPSKGLAITYLVRFSIGSPSGGRSEIENLNVIKKIREGFLDFPYASSQAMKRALKETMKGLGYSPLSPVIRSSPAKTVGDPVKYLDDDLFGYMNASSKKTGNSEVDRLNGTRKAVVSMVPLLSLSSFQDNVDFGANMMGLRTGGDPMPYETEVHRGWYRISLYVELDRIGTGDGFVTGITDVKTVKTGEIASNNQQYDFLVEGEKDTFVLKKIQYSSVVDDQERYRRAKSLVDAIRFLAPSGRSSNWLIDLTPKLMAAAYVRGARTPFLESKLIDDKDEIDTTNIKAVVDTFEDGFVKQDQDVQMVVGYRPDHFNKPTNTNGIEIKGLKEAFGTIEGWLKAHFGITN